MKRGKQEAAYALGLLSAAFQVATATGLFDDLAAEVHPDAINALCDAVTAREKAEGKHRGYQAAWLVVWTRRKEAGEPTTADGGEDKDGYQVFGVDEEDGAQAEREARAFYAKKLKQADTYACHLVRVMRSSDYSGLEPEVKG